MTQRQKPMASGNGVQLLNALSAHAALLDPRGTIASANRAWMQFGESNGAKNLQIIGPGTNYIEVCERTEGPEAENAEACLVGIERLLIGDAASFQMAYPCHSPTEKRWFRLDAQTVDDPAGKVLIVHHDITREVVARNTLDRLTSLLDVTHSAIAVWDQNGDNVYWNHAFSHLLEHVSGALDSDSFFQAVNASDGLGQEMLADVRRGISVSTEVRLSPLDKPTHMLRVQIDPIIDQKDGFRGCIATCVDTPARELSYLENLRAQRMDAASQTAAGIAREFDGLFTTILGRCQLLKDSFTQNSLLMQDLSAIEEATRKASHISRLLAELQPTAKQGGRADLNQVVEQSLSLLRSGVSPDVEILCDLHPNELTVHGNTSQVGFIVSELLASSSRALKGHGKITVRTRSCDSDQSTGTAVLEIEDTRPQIPSQHIPTLFEPFKETGHANKLALASVYAALKGLGGEIDVDSRPTQTTFTVQLNRSDRRASSVSERPTPSNPCGGHEMILLVEEEAPVRAMIRRLLRQHGYSVISGSPDDARALFQDSQPPFELLITSTTIDPNQHRSLLRAVHTSRPDLKTLCLVHQGEAELPGLTDEMASTTKLPKPFAPMLLLMEVRRLLDEAKTAEAVETADIVSL
jgi:two-component system, cell cycle sensor histidine kinase and response regulator CckA